MTIIQTIGAWIASAGIFIGSLLGYSQPLGNIPQATALFETSLQAPITSSDTSATLISGTTKDGNSLSGIYGFIIDEGTSKAEVVICAASGTALTACRRGISWDNGTSTVAANQKAHNKGATVKITDHPTLIQMDNILRGTAPLYSTIYGAYAVASPSSTAHIDRAYLDSTSTNYVSVAGSQTITGQKFFTATTSFTKAPTSVSPIASDELATKGYVDSVAIAGSASSSLTVYGISKLSAAPADANIPIAVGTNDTRLDNYISGVASVASTTCTTSLDADEDMLVFAEGYTGAGNYYICIRYASVTSTIATGKEGNSNSWGHITGYFDNSSTSAAVVTIALTSSSTCPAEATGQLSDGQITYIKIK